MAATERGGGETFDLEIARHLAKRGHEVTFLSNRPLLSCKSIAECKTQNEEQRTTNGERSITKPRFVMLRSPMFPWFPWDRVKGGWRVRVAEFWLFEKLAARWAWKRRERFDVIQVCELPTLVSTWKKRVSRIPAQRGASPHLASRIPPVVLRLTAPNVYDPTGGIQQADAVIASGTSIAKIRKALRPDCYDVPNGVDLNRFQAVGRSFQVTEHTKKQKTTTAYKQRRTKNEERRTLLYVARFQVFKNHALLLKALAAVREAHPDLQLWFAGSGPLQSDMKQLAARLGLASSVRFLGEVPFESLPDIYAQADIKVISSEYESFCFAAIEGMASGLPVVTTDCGWVPRLIGDTLEPIERQWVEGDDPAERFPENRDGERIRAAPGGLVVSRTEPHSMAQAIARLTASDEERARMGKWNREKAERDHGWESSAEKLETLYETLLRDGHV